MKRNSASMATLLLLFHAASGYGQTGAKDDAHVRMMSRGDHVMGFSQEKTTHHFRLYAGGGAIEVTANNADDDATRDEIQMHLSHIAGMFSEGDFQAPMLIHDKIPPGVPTLKRLKAEVSYHFEKLDTGGRVRITTGNGEALKAIHAFLRFQISDHRTGDTTKVTPRP
jgi:hypothetical protein